MCPSKRETVFLNLDPEYEYRPDHYEEVLCEKHQNQNDNRIQAEVSLSSYESNLSDEIHNFFLFEKVCSEAGFSCIQLNRTLFLTRRIRGASCWESETRLIPAGCECMWPKHHLGDIMAHH